MTRSDIPMLLTYLRIVIVFVIIATYMLMNQPMLPITILFFIAGISDFLDGYLARKWKAESSFGAFLDPVADKILVSSLLVIFVEYYKHPFITFSAVLIIMREILMASLREWSLTAGNSVSLSVSFLGKIKTTFQILALMGLLLAPLKLGLWQYDDMFQGAIICLGVALVLTWYSFIDYLQRFLAHKS